jgi:hypothetical protein
MANFPGTNIPISSFKGSDSKKEELINRLNQDKAAGDIQGMNDAIFDVAYYSVGGQGQGQGNANVSKIHNGTWEVTADVGANTTWAEDNINSEGDGYVQVGGKKKGSLVEFSNTSGVLVDKKSTGSWGGWDNVEFNRDTGEKNVYFKDDPKVDLPESGVEVDTSGYPNQVLTGDPNKITSGVTAYGADTKWGDRNVESGGAGAANLLDYRPWTKNYWSQNISRDPAAQGLLYMDKPQREYGLSYLPGEHRDPGAWHDWVMGGHKGQPPGGGWRTQPANYVVGADRAKSAVTGEAFPSYFKKGSRVPWQFTAPGSLYDSATNKLVPSYNVDFSPWNATSMNLNAAQGKGWQGLLSGLGDTPTINTSTKSLLGV